MSIRLVRTQDDEILRKKSKIVSKIDDKIKELIVDMKDTMTHHNGCGLAAVQVGVLKNIIICEASEEDGIMTLINPQIVESSEEQVEDYEGCLSIEGYRGKVKRPKSIVVHANDENMKEFEFDAEDFLARIICHEVDHLNGILYTDKVIDGTLEDINEINKDENN